MSGYLTTPNLGLKKPTTGADDDLWGTHWNQNADVIDTQVLTRSSGAAIIGDAPDAATYAPLWWDSNSGQLFVQYDDGSSVQWVSANSIDASTLEGSFLPLTGGTVDHANATTGLFSGIATIDMRIPAYSDGFEHRTWVGLSDNGLMTYYDTQSQMAVIPPSAFALGIAASVRSSDRLHGPNTANIGIAAFNKSDSSDPNAGITWAFYGTSRKVPNSTNTIGMELSMGCVGQGATDVNPYQTGGNNSAVGLWMSSGSEAFEAGLDVHPASSALNVVSNGSTWDKGLVFGINALTANATTGDMIAIQLGAKQEIQWVYDNVIGHRSGFIRSDGTAAGGTGIVFTTTAFNVVNAATEAGLLSVAASGNTSIQGSLQAAGHSFLNGGASVTGLLNTVNGIRFDGTPTSISDLSFHINLSAGTYGINAYANAMNFNIPTGANFDFVVGGGSIGYIDATGINYMPIGQTGARAGSFTTLAASGAATLGGVGFGSVFASSGTDLSKHLALYSTNYGLNVPATNTMNVVVAGFTQATFSAVGYVAVAGYLAIGGVSGPTWTTGSGVPSSTQPVGSIYSRVSTWAAGATLYVSKGAGAWTPVAAV
jgi:hypothetical protein